MNEITLTQQPIIEFSHLDRIAAQVDTRLSVYNFDQLIVDEENVKGIKELRATLKKEFTEFEDVRKTIKKGVLNPYEVFESKFKELIASKYTEADSKLKVLIDTVEDKLKQEKEDEVKIHFENCKYANDIDFISWEQSNIKVGLSDSIKSLKDKAQAFVKSVSDDLELIKTQPNAERILVRYRTSLDVKGSITSVLREIEQENALKSLHAVKIEDEPVEVKPIEITEPVEMITVSFTVTATKQNIRDLREFMKERGIIYE